MLKSNVILKLAAVVIVILLFVLITSGRNKKLKAVDDNFGIEDELVSMNIGPKGEHNGLDLDPLGNDFLEDEYGVDVDSPVETMRTLTKETSAVREDSVKLQEANKKASQEVNRLLHMEETITKRINSSFSKSDERAAEKEKKIEKQQQETRNLIETLKQKIESLDGEKGKRKRGSGSTNANGYDVSGSEIPTGLGYDDEGMSISYDEVVWINPIDAKINPEKPNEIIMPDFSSTKNSVINGAKKVSSKTGAAKQTKEERLIKAYTIPENSTLIGSVSLTALLGRIPINGQVIDPYPFKIVIGEQNLSSNGIKIPGVVGIKMSGIAKGDWTLSCVSGKITSMTFTFRDGTISTFPEPGTKSEEPIAWFSDTYGIPCITGKRITNAPAYLSQRVALTTASSYSNAEAQSGILTQQTGDTLTSGIVDSKTLAKNAAVADGLNEVTDWLDARQANSFDAIYVPPDTKLAVHIIQELKIDYDPEGRKVNHYANTNKRSDSHID